MRNDYIVPHWNKRLCIIVWVRRKAVYLNIYSIFFTKRNAQTAINFNLLISYNYWDLEVQPTMINRLVYFDYVFKSLEFVVTRMGVKNLSEFYL